MVVVPNHPSAHFAVSDTVTAKSDRGTSRCRCSETPSFGTCSQFKSCWTILAWVSEIHVGHPHPPLNVSVSTAVCVRSAVDEGWTAGSTGNPEIARQTTWVKLSYLLAWVGWILVSTCILNNSCLIQYKAIKCWKVWSPVTLMCTSWILLTWFCRSLLSCCIVKLYCLNSVKKVISTAHHLAK